MKAPSRPIKIDDRPLYIQAVDALKALLAGYEPGAQLPPENDLAGQLGISRTTLRMAMGHLELQGLIVRRQGIGTFAAEPSPVSLRGGLQTLTSVSALARAAGLETATSQRVISTTPATPEWAQILEVEPGVELCRTQCIIAIEGRPVAFLDTLAPPRLAPLDALQESDGSLLEFLLDRGTPALAYTQTQIFAVEADQEMSKRLDVPVDKALLHLAETYFTVDGTPVALSFNFFVSDRMNFTIGRQIDNQRGESV